MKVTPSPVDAGLLDASQTVLKRVSGRTDSLVFASLCRLDGRLVSHVGKPGVPDGQRISAMNSSLLGLAEAFAKEALRSPCSHISIAAETGSIIAVRVPSRSNALALSICFDKGENLAMALRLAFDCARELAEVVDSVT